MKQAICIKTTPERYEWLNNMLTSLKGYDKYPIIILSTNHPSYYQYPQLINTDEIMLLHDSMVITDTKMFEICFEQHRGKSVSFVGEIKGNKTVYKPFAMGLGKFKTKLLKKIKMPTIRNKEEDYAFEEWFGWAYYKLDPDTELLIPDFKEGSMDPIEMFGTMRTVITTPYFIKYKSIR